MKRRHYFLLTFVFLVGLAALDVAVILSPSKVRALISAELEATVKVPIEYEGISPSGLSSIRVTGIRVWRDEARTEPILECREMIATLDFRALLEREIKVDRVELVEPVVHLAWDENKKLDLPSILRESRSTQRAATIPEIAVRDLELVFAGAPFWNEEADVRLHGIDIELTPRRSKVFPYSFEGTIDDPIFGHFSMRGDFGTRVRGVVERKEFRLEDRHVECLDPALRDVVREFGMEGAIDVEVDIESEDLLDHVDVEVLAVARDVRLRHDRWPAHVDALNGTLRWHRKRITADDLEMRLDGSYVRFQRAEVDLSGEGLEFVMAGHATDWTIDPDFAESLRAYPDDPMADVREAIEAFEIDGKLDYDFALSRKRGARRTEVSFDVDLREVDLRFIGYPDRVTGRREGYPYPIERALGRVRITNDRLEFHDLHSAVRSPDFQADGRIDFGDASAGTGMDIEIRGRDFKLDHRIRDTLPETDRKVLASYSPEGAVDFDLTVRRDRHAAGPASATLIVDLDGVTATPEPFPYLLHDIEGKLVFDDGPTRVLGVTARHGRTAIRVDGLVDLASTVGDPFYELNVEAENVELDDDLLTALSHEFADIASEVRRFNFEGDVDFSCRIDSRDEGARDRYEIDLNGLAFRYDVFPHVRVTGLRGRLVAEGDRLTIEPGARMRCCGSEFDAGGWVGLTGDDAHDITVVCDTFKLNEQAMVAAAQAAPEIGDIEEVVDIAGTIGLRIRLKRSPRGSLNRVGVTAKGLVVTGKTIPFAVTDVFGTLTTSGQDVAFDTWTGLVAYDGTGPDADRLVLGVRGGHYRSKRGEHRLVLDGVTFSNLSFEERILSMLPDDVAAKMKELGLRGRVDGHLDSLLHRGGLTRFEGRIHPRDVRLDPGIAVGFNRGVIVVEDAAFRDDDLEVKGHLEDSDLILHHFSLKDVSARFEIDGESFAVRDIGGRVLEGRLAEESSLFVMDFASPQPFRAAVSISEANISALIDELGGNPRSVEGIANGRASIEGDLEDSETWTGDGRILMNGRRLYDLPFFAVVFELINFDFLTSPDANQSGELDLTVADETVTLAKADFRGPGINLEGKGEIGFDGICRLEFDPKPVKWLDPVPLVGEVVDFIRGFIASTILVTGPIEDPKATALNHITEILPTDEDSGRRLKIKPLKKDQKQ